MTQPYPKRLIEVDLPIARISAHARREKAIRHGHISTLHIWWARRPLAACRAVTCAALWPDPADPLCPPRFRHAASELITRFARRVFPERITEESRQLQSEKHLSPEGRARWEAVARGTLTLDPEDDADWFMLRMCLLDFIADFANWDNSTVPAYLETSRALTQAAHEALGGVPGTRPLVVDPFAGGGSIPLEALRVGADAFASDLNPIPVLLNKVVLEYIPKYGQKLADEVRKWGQWIKERAQEELGQYYPADEDGATPIAYLWARTIRCEGPGCGAEVPLVRSLWLCKKRGRTVGMRLLPRTDKSGVDIEIIPNPKPSEAEAGTVQRGSATCPCCGYTTPVASVRTQLKSRRGGAADARLLCVVTTRSGEQGRHYRLPTERDIKAILAAEQELERRKRSHTGPLSLVPDEPLPPEGSLGFRVQKYGMVHWGDLLTPRQALALTTLVRLSRQAGERCDETSNSDIAEALATCLAMVVDRQADATSSLCRWHTSGEKHTATFGRQALPMVWDFSEVNVLSDLTGGLSGALAWVTKVCVANTATSSVPGHTHQASATNHPLPNDSARAFITDPPYYDAVPYADLSDFFYVWLRRTLLQKHPALLSEQTTRKEEECIVDETKGLTAQKFEATMQEAMAEGRRILTPSGVGLVVFAHKSTGSWESQLRAMIDAGWIMTASWPIDTEMGARLRAMNSAALASSVHLVCRPRENPDGSLREDVGEWRDVLTELPKRIHEWMPRLAAEGVVGADAIFACLGPALEIFSRYSRVEKASGEAVPLREYLEQVWGAVSTEALSMIFRDADAAGLEPDARLTAMWLWTLGAGGENGGGGSGEKVVASTGYTLEFDAARKIAQGLGIHLEKSEQIVEVKGDKARLLPVSERTRFLFGREDALAATARGRKKPKKKQRSLFEELEALEAETDRGDAGDLQAAPGETVLDRVHQAMILFAAGRGEALRRFLVDDGAGTDARFWKLAQSLSALYPRETDEKRWVDGVLARKKGLGL